MPDANGLKTPEELREPWAVQLAKEVIAKVQWTHPEAQSRLVSFEIVSDEYQDFAAQLLREVKAEWSAVEEERKKITKPLNEATKATNALFKPVLGALESAEQILKNKIAGYLQAKQNANTAALMASVQLETPQQAMQVISQIEPVQAPQGVSVRKVWKFVIENPDLVPREFCSPDESKIRLVDPTTASIPGIRFFQEDVVTARK
jgi:hypothetical protein